MNLEEARALRRAVTHRAKFRDELNVRCLHPVDNAACVGAAAKGRSASFALNGEMQKIAATQLLAGHFAFYVWIAPKENPADAPSSWYGSRARGQAHAAERSDVAGPVRMMPEACEHSILVLARSHEEEDSLMGRLRSSCAERGLRVACMGGHSPESDVALDGAHERLQSQAVSGVLCLLVVVLPQDLCQRQAKGTRPAARHSWDRRVLRFQRALALCDLMPSDAHHVVVSCIGGNDSRRSGPLSSMYQSYCGRDDVEEHHCDLGCFGSGRLQRVTVASNLAGLHVLDSRSNVGVPVGVSRAPPGLAPLPAARLLEALCAELAVVAAAGLEHAGRRLRGLRAGLPARLGRE